MRSLAYLWEFFLLFLGSLTLETRMMYVDVYVCAYSCDGRPGLATDHGTGRGLSHVPPCFQTVSAVHHCMYWATWPVHLPSCYQNTGIAGTLLCRAFTWVPERQTQPPPQPPPHVCPVSTFPTEPSLQSRGRIFVDKIQQKD